MTVYILRDDMRPGHLRIQNEDELCHYGIKGQRWYHRRFQNEDGTLTPAGKERYSIQNQYKVVVKGREKARSKMILAKNMPSYGAAVGISAGVASFGVGAASLNPVLGAASVVAMPITALASGFASQKLANRLKERAQEQYENVETGGPIRDNVVVLPAGTQMTRVSTRPKEETGKRIYASYAEDQNLKDYYTKYWPQVLKRVSGRADTKVYKNTYEVSTELLAPDKETRMKAAHAVLNASDAMYRELGRAYAKNYIGNYDQSWMGGKSKKEIEKYFINRFKGNTPSEVKRWLKDRYDYAYKEGSDRNRLNANRDEQFRKFRSTIPSSPKLMSAYIQELRKQGYNCVFDDNANASSAFIIFDVKDLKQTGSEQIA